MRARRSTLVLTGSWVALFVLYLFVKPDIVPEPRPAPVPAAPVALVPAIGVPPR